MKSIFTSIFLLISIQTFSQLTTTQTPTGAPLPIAATTAQQAQEAWYRGGNNPNPSLSNIFGTFWNSEVHHYTNGTRKFTTTVNNGLTNNGFNAVLGTVNGDGISVAQGVGSASFASIDLFTTNSNRTHFRMGQAFLTQTSSNRVEQYANFNGFWYNATGLTTAGTSATPQYIWNIIGVEKGRLGNNGWWKFGNNPTNLVAGNIVEISTTNAIGNPYGFFASGLRFRNLTSTAAIIPNGVNGVNSTKVLTVDGNGDVVLTTPSGATASNNGLQTSGGFVQLGGLCGNLVEEFNGRLLNNRKVELYKNNLIFYQKPSISGRIGIGDILNCFPGNLLEVTKNSGPPSATGLSGLRLGDLKAGAFVNPSNGKALSIDANGDVILVTSSSGGVSLCNAAPVNNVVKVTAIGTTICQTNITDLNPVGYDGINNTAPNDALDVAPSCSACIGDGNIDVNDPISRYEINDDPILWHKGVVNNLYVGVNAGQSTPTGPGGMDNTFVGFSAASAFTTANCLSNTMIGAEAGNTLVNANSNTYVGYHTGFAANSVNNNTYLGAEAGANNVPGADENVLIGWRAGMNIAGLHNVCIGNNSGYNNSGFQNTFVGIGSGFNVTGQYNASLGGGSGPGIPALNNTIALGNGAISMVSNTLILGDNTVNSGIGLSSDPIGPQNKLEINTTAGSPYFGSPNGSSGLRFRNMTSTVTPTPNPGNGVLSVDPNGDVIYVNAPSGGGGVGNYCGSTPNPLTSDFEVPTNNNIYRFTGQGIINNAGNNENIVSVGYNCLQIPPAHFSVLESQTGGPTNQTYAGHFKNDNASQVGFNYITGGVYGEAKALELGLPFANPAINAGGVFEGNGTRASIGVFGRMSNASIPYPGSLLAPNARYAIGGAFMSDDAITNPWGPTANIGAYGHASNSMVMSAGVYGHTPLNTSGIGFNYGIYAQSPVGLNNLSLYVDGDAFINGTGTISPSPWIVSDARFKKDIVGIDNAISMLKKFRPTQYHHAVKNPWGMHFDDRLNYGFIAQEVEKEFPELIKEQRKPAMFDEHGKAKTEEITFKAVNYTAVIPMLVKGIQEQQNQLDEMQQQLEEQKKLNDDLKQRLDALEKLIVNNSTQQKTELKANQEVVLFQNVPNPFSEKTTIRYTLPSNFKIAQIQIRSTTGNVIKTVDLNRDSKELVVYANDISSGLFTYSLLVDGKVIATKKMVIER